MREINFRAWNEVEGFLDTAWSIDFEHRLVCHRAHNQSDLDDCVLMQYTGLQDKNGREIYEGDILRVWVTKTINFVATVDCLNGAFGIGSIPSGYGYHHKFSSFHNNVGTRYEVIGNIYENKELLEEK